MSNDTEVAVCVMADLPSHKKYIIRPTGHAREGSRYALEASFTMTNGTESVAYRFPCSTQNALPTMHKRARAVYHKLATYRRDR